LGLLLTNTLCWARYERFSLGRYTQEGLSWMFRRAHIFWDFLLKASVLHLVQTYRIRSGVLVIDDTDRERSKNTTQIAKVHTIKDKKTGGYYKGQNLVFLVLVTEKFTLPISFYFHESDPQKKAWRKEEARLKAKKVEKRHRPKEPEANPDYPSKKTLALKLLSDFMDQFKDIKVRAVAADAYYGTFDFMEQTATVTKQPQVISQIKKTQLIVVNNKEIAVGDFFKNYHGKEEELTLREKEKKIIYRSAKFKVKSHKKKYLIIALKYEDEEAYRYLLARDMTWRDVEVIKTFAFRWLVEVFIQDWKMYEGWNQLAKQPGEEGSTRGVTLSLLTDHALLLHHDQKILLENKKPAATVGSLREKVMMESLKDFIEKIVMSDDPKAMFDKYANDISEVFQLNSSIKHMRSAEEKLL
jgi:hypothetical protein